MINKKKIASSGKDVACVLGGVIAGNMAMKSVPHKFLPGAMLVAGTVGAATLKNDTVKTIALGVAAFGAITTLNQLAAPKAGEFQTGYKAMIAKAVPTIQGTPGLGNLANIDMSDYDYEQIEGLQGDEEMAENLLGMGQYDEEYYDELQGLDGDEAMAEALLGFDGY